MKLIDHPNSTIKFVIETLKAGIIYERLLSPFEIEFLVNLSFRYAKFGLSLNIEAEQLKVLSEIGKKLNVLDSLIS